MIVNSGFQRAATSLKSIFQSISTESCPLIYNFHLHTVHSDGQLSPELLIQQAVSYQLKGLAITDHHTVAGYRAAKQWLDDWRSSHLPDGQTAPTLWTGIEITADLLGGDVHILGYGFDPIHAAIQPYLGGQAPVGEASRASEVVQSIQRAGGLAVLAHPVRYRRSPAELIPAAVRLGIDGIEAYYCYGNLDPWSPSPSQTQQVLALGKAYGLLRTCGTDTHGMSILKRL
jgi:predicted metal-dependent phosphoesterase TrpH